MKNPSEFSKFLIKKYPNLGQSADFNQGDSELISPQLLCPYVVQLPKTVLSQAQKAISAAFALRQNPDYQNFLHRNSSTNLVDPGNFSIMMSYDFHIDQQNNLKLIEINTNAAFLALGTCLYEFQQIPHPISQFKITDLKDCILNELQLFKSHNKLTSHQSSRPLSIAIMDKSPNTQRLYIEFLVFNELFKQFGFNSQICDIEKIPKEVDLIYNRYTDFYFQDPQSQTLKTLFLEGKCCFSPNPNEYFLLADKNRLVQWSQPDFLERFLNSEHLINLKNTLLETLPLNDSNKEELWKNRKQYFFKPSQEFGSKGSFKGSSISRRAFDELLKGPSIAQEYLPAPEFKHLAPDGTEQTYKYDLRIFAYKDQIQSIIARVYQGQVTNLRTPNGGFACVQFNDRH